ncbi:P-loop NTPase fold protein [Lacticaseibacillus paracasei]|uniref:P-loop NTPase fold protein n=1 Tax=Lacticaseibacillus paracasei TaxID=1597 RepID=UPI000F43B193|nr:P-loop NTPase fold protein [Lacticaseibacillus paracasei]RND50819.1 hypothetical protein FAM18113_02746 [Lacticaseibacillus paracasei]
MIDKTIRNRQITIENIPTKEAAQNFLDSIEPGKNYFLNGDWGSGKTEFIDEIQQCSTEKKFISLDLWHIVDERSVVTRGFCALHPFIYKSLRVLFVMCVSLSIVMTGISKIKLPFLTNNCVSSFIGCVALFVAVWSFFKVKSDQVYVKLLKLGAQNKDKILIIDDFDRVSSTMQKQAYLFFNVIQGKYTVIFVGDLSKISLARGSYLRKIIDLKVNLPYALQPINIWGKYFDTVASHLQLTSDERFSLEKLAIDESRNLRDQKQFNELLNREFYDKNKIDRVKAYDQLIIIYLYLFHEEAYELLLSGKIKNDSDILYFSKKLKLTNTDTYPNPTDMEDAKSGAAENISSHLEKALEQLVSGSLGTYPQCFRMNNQPYFISEASSNRTIKDLQSILNNSKSLKEELASKSRTDYYDYLLTNLDKIKPEEYNIVLNESIKLFHGGIMTMFTNLVLNSFNQKMRDELNDREDDLRITALNTVEDIDIQYAKDLYTKWKNKLNEFEYDTSEVAFLMIENRFINYEQLSRVLVDEDVMKIPPHNYKRPDIMLLLYLSRNRLWEKYSKWPSSVWKTINELPKSLFIHFLFEQRLIEKEPSLNTDPLSRKQFILVTSYQDFDPPFETHMTECALQKINNRIHSLEHKGYVFIKKPSITRNFNYRNN